MKVTSEIPVVANVDVLVAGGGPGGFGAAVAAARAGANTLLIERWAALGGVASMAQMAIYLIPTKYLSGLTKEHFDLMLGNGDAWGGTICHFDTEAYKECAFQMTTKAGVKHLLYTWVVDTIMDGNHIKGVIVANKGGLQAILAKVVIDATGDADVAFRAGVPCNKGREKDGKLRPVTNMMRLGNLDFKKIVEYCKTHPEHFTHDPSFQVLELENELLRVSGYFNECTAAKERGELDKDLHYIRFEGTNVKRGTTYVNASRVYDHDCTDPWQLTEAELIARAQNRQLFKLIRTFPGCEDAWMIDQGPVMGVRETRRTVGEYVFDEKDVAERRTFEDNIARVWRRWQPGADMHGPDRNEGLQGDILSHGKEIEVLPVHIPYRCLVPLKVDGLLTAGRILSVTYLGETFTRAMYICTVVGQASGTAAAIAADKGILPRHIDVNELQKKLLAQGSELGEISKKSKGGSIKQKGASHDASIR